MQNNNVKISVIMPVYNVANYLDKAIRSVLDQTFTEFELIIVNDGSTDATKNICEKFTESDDRIKLINQENAGAHRARNVAIDLSVGEYICFFDGDDYIDKDMLSDLYSLITKYQCDLAISGFNINTYYNDSDYVVYKYTPVVGTDDVMVFHNKTDFRKSAYLNFDKNMFYPPWNKLFSSSYIKNNKIYFPITYRDDFPFVLEVIKDIENVLFTKNTYYNFIRKRADSETQKYVANLYEKREEEHSKLLNLYEHWGLTDDINSIEMISRRYIDRIIECIVNLFNKNCTLSKTEKIDCIKKYIETDNFNSSIKYAKPKKLYLKLMYLPLQMKSTQICYLMGKFINFIKTKNIKIFSSLKTYR